MRDVIRIEGLAYRYPGQGAAALRDIDLTVEEGEFVLLMGPSGCGKTTLLRAMNGAVPHMYGGEFSGCVGICGRDSRDASPKDLADTVGMVFQDPEAQLVMTSPENEVRFGLENLGLRDDEIERRIEESLEIANIGNFRKRFIPELSGGEKQKLALASIIAMDTNIILLDEPTSQLDPKAAEEILAILKKFNEERGVTVVLVEHRLERCLQFADRAVFLREGEIILDERTEDYIRKGRNMKGILLPPVTRLAGVHGNEAPVTVKEARKIVHRALAKGELTFSSRLTPIRTGRELIKLRKVDFSYSEKKAVLSGVDVTIKEGDRIALMGRNGAGKSTLLKLLNGILKPGKGRVIVNGMDTKRTATSRLAATCGYLSQNPSDYLFRKTVEEEIFLGVKKPRENLSHIAWIIESLSLERHLDSYPRDLSAGERERVALASILALRPRVLALDEPTRGMDYTQKDRLSILLKESGKKGIASIVATHDVEFVTAFANRVIILGDGRILRDGPPKKVLPGSMLFAPQTNLATRGFSEFGLRGDIIHPGELRWKSPGMERGGHDKNRNRARKKCKNRGSGK